MTLIQLSAFCPVAHGNFASLQRYIVQCVEMQLLKIFESAQLHMYGVVELEIDAVSREAKSCVGVYQTMDQTHDRVGVWSCIVTRMSRCRCYLGGMYPRGVSGLELPRAASALVSQSGCVGFSLLYAWFRLECGGQVDSFYPMYLVWKVLVSYG